MKKLLIKKIIFKCVILITFIFTLSTAKPIVLNQIALLQMQNSNQAIIIMNTFNLIYSIGIIGLGLPMIRDIYKTFIETKEKNK